MKEYTISPSSLRNIFLNSQKPMFKAKLRRIGNSQGVYIPSNVITEYEIGEEITLEVITNKPKEVITKSLLDDSAKKVITKDKEKRGLVFNLKKGIYEQK